MARHPLFAHGVWAPGHPESGGIATPQRQEIGDHLLDSP
jgi:hypothetical protein